MIKLRFCCVANCRSLDSSPSTALGVVARDDTGKKLASSPVMTQNMGGWL